MPFRGVPPDAGRRGNLRKHAIGGNKPMQKGTGCYRNQSNSTGWRKYPGLPYIRYAQYKQQAGTRNGTNIRYSFQERGFFKETKRTCQALNKHGGRLPGTSPFGVKRTFCVPESCSIGGGLLKGGRLCSCFHGTPCVFDISTFMRLAPVLAFLGDFFFPVQQSAFVTFIECFLVFKQFGNHYFPSQACPFRVQSFVTTGIIAHGGGEVEGCLK